MKISQTEQNLINIATQVVNDNLDLYPEKELVVGCAILTKTGNIYKGINVKTSHSVCAEQVAIGQAFACGEREFDTIVTVKKCKDGSVRIISPCGLCRYIFEKLNIDMNVFVEDKKGSVKKVKTSELLPYPYKRENNAN